MNVHLDRIFPTPIWSADFDINNKEIYDWCKEIQKNDPKGANKSNHGGWQSSDIDLEKYLFAAASTPYDRLPKKIVLR